MNPKPIIAAAVTALLLTGAAAWSWRSAQSLTAELNASSPDACLVAMTRAAQLGDVPAYLDCFGGALRDELDAQHRADAGAAALGQQLRLSVAELKGAASYEEYPATADGAQMILERIYPHHNERWRVAMRRDGDTWRITTMSRIGSSTPPVEYGTPVFAIDEPEMNVNERK